MATFRGVATGRSYTSGSVYTTGNGYMYLANPDGSFTNMFTGVMLGGSSGRGNEMGYAGMDDRFGGGGRGGDSVAADGPGRPSFRISEGPGADLVVVPGSRVTVGPGSPLVDLAFKPGGVNPPGSSSRDDGSRPAKPVTTGPGAKIATVKGGSRLKMGEYAPVTPIMMDGVEVIHDKGWSDAGEAEERWGEGELGSPSWFYSWGVAFADLASQPGNESIRSTIDSTKKELMWLNGVSNWVRGVPPRGNEYRDENFLGEGYNPMIPHPELRGAVEW